VLLRTSRPLPRRRRPVGRSGQVHARDPRHLSAPSDSRRAR